MDTRAKSKKENAIAASPALGTALPRAVAPIEAGELDLLGTPDILFTAPGNAPTILIVEETEISRRMMRAFLLGHSQNRDEEPPYRIIEARRPTEALEIVSREKIDLVILDFVMSDMTGPEFCQRFRADKRTHLVPVLMLASVQGSENEVAGITSGADEFLIKPVHPAVLRARVGSMLRHKAAIDSLEEVESILFTLAQTVEQRDHYTGMHCQRLATYGVAIGLKLGLSREQLLALYRGGFLHDIGKISVPDSILYKKSLLSDDEWEIMRSHTTRGEEICRPMKSLAPVLPIIRNHHERWDGTGYPDQLSGEQIPLLARILQIVDIYDALTTSRPYKPAWTHHEAIAILGQEAQRGWRDPEMVKALHEVFLNPPEVMREALMGPSLAALNEELR
ncbi:MAG: HD domain-containing protein [Bryobacteraceae bacterium]|nr:HD domain-containing protein [Bryobacteraceae bacterium]